MIEKQRKLRKIEMVFTDDQVNPIVHCEYDVIIFEDGIELFRKKQRENAEASKIKDMIAKSKIYASIENAI